MSASSGFVLVILAASWLSGDSRFIAEPLVAVFKTLHALCQRLPKDQASECESQVKTYLPKLLRQSPDQQNELQKPPRRVTSLDVPGAALSSASKNPESLNPICPLCLLVIKKLESLLPKNMTEETLMKLMEEVCDLIPKSYKDQCDDFVSKYGAEIVEFLLSSAAPHTICTLLHLCLFETQPVADVAPPSDCESCQTLAALSRMYLGLNATEPQTSAFLQSVCLRHPNAVPKCEAFTRIYGLQLQRLLGNQMNVPHVCERADLCVSSKQLELLGKNPCTWGPSYWCKDPETAQKCGNQVFCEKYKWKK
ncbi:surfactant protein Bb isoform X6 [Kryptolebias marmoratus]|uniref:surfactant protein Bb isoform X6 n=1 Tax=Kryptolebias marmoratus TaxID=37003 RepID=UPI0018ACD365|nr:surfactant protein Bb isoform X6 [Kryptolebias marmoratus]